MFRHLRENKLYLKLEKSKFEVEEIDFLGLIISNSSIWMDPIKTKAVQEWARCKAVMPFNVAARKPRTSARSSAIRGGSATGSKANVCTRKL